MWTEWVHDPKMLGLTLSETGAWWKLVTLAQECGADGPLVKGNGSPLTITEIANSLHLSSPKDRKTLEGMISKMAGLGSLHWNSNVLVVTHFAERQALSPSATREAVRDRVRRHRERAVTENPLPPVTNEPALAKIATLHEEFFGLITPVLSEKFKDFVENYRGPVEWIDLAFAEAVKYKNRRWQYVEKILYSWQEKGGPDDGRGKSTSGANRPGTRGHTAKELRDSLRRSRPA
ncbi:hypothetical protein ES703_80904 [subsurface metagenome]